MKTLRKGNTGSVVMYLQQRLNRHGFGPLKEDADFGQKTYNAVHQFQSAQGLTADGIVGGRTWRELQVEGRDSSPHEASGHNELKKLAKHHLRGEKKVEVRLAVCLAAIGDVGLREIPDGSNEGPQIKHLVGGYTDFHEYSAEDLKKYGIPPWCAIAVTSWVRIALSPASGPDMQSKPEDTWDAEASDWIIPNNLIDWDQTPFKTWIGGCRKLEEWGQERETELDLPEGAVFGFSKAQTAVWPTGAIFTMPRGDSSSDPQTSLKNGHCGIIIADLGRTIITVDGNVGNGVKFMERKKAGLRGFVRWWL